MYEGGALKIEYTLPGVIMDTSKPSPNLPDGVCSRLTGVDGRFTGTLKKFPGFERVSSVDSSGMYIRPGTSLNSYSLKSSSSDTVLINDGYRYHFEEGEIPKVYTLTGTTASNLGAWDNSVFMSTGWSGSAGVSVGTATAASTGGFLAFNGSYQVALMYYDSGRDLYTGLSTPADVVPQSIDSELTTGETCKVTLPITMPTDGHWTHIAVFRTMNLRNPFDTYQGGVFYQESLVPEADVGAGYTVGLGVLPDISLVQGKRYDPYADPNMEPPRTGAAIIVENTIIAGRSDGATLLPGFVWSNPYDSSNEEFSESFQYKGEGMDGPVRRFIRAGENIMAFTDSVFYRITKNGGNISVYRFGAGRVPVTKDAIVAIGDDFVMVTPQGLTHMQGSNGSMTQISAADRIILSEWASSSGGLDIAMAYDSTMSCIFILNRSSNYNGGKRGDILCLWEKTKTLSLITNTPYSNCINGPDVSSDDTGYNRAYFYFGLAAYAPAYSDPTYETVSGTAGTVGAGITTVAGLAADLELDRGYIYFTGGTLKGTYVAWYTNIDDDLIYDDEVVLTAGDTYIFGPIVFEARLWPFRAEHEPVFGRKITTAMTAKMGNFSTTPSASDVITMGFFSDKMGQYDDDLASGSKLIAMSTHPDSMTARVNASGITIEPYLKEISNIGFELTNVGVYGTITRSNKNVGV